MAKKNGKVKQIEEKKETEREGKGEVQVRKVLREKDNGEEKVESKREEKQR